MGRDVHGAPYDEVEKLRRFACRIQSSWFDIWIEANRIGNDHALLLRAALAGVDLVPAMEPQLRAQRAAGTLASVLDAFLPPDDSLYFYYPSRARLQRRCARSRISCASD